MHHERHRQDPQALEDQEHLGGHQRVGVVFGFLELGEFGLREALSLLDATTPILRGMVLHNLALLAHRRGEPEASTNLGRPMIIAAIRPCELARKLTETAEFDNTRASQGAALLQYRALMIGQKTSAGTATHCVPCVPN